MSGSSDSYSENDIPFHNHVRPPPPPAPAFRLVVLILEVLTLKCARKRLLRYGYSLEVYLDRTEIVVNESNRRLLLNWVPRYIRRPM